MYFVKEYFEEIMQKEQGRSNRSQEYASLPGEAAKTVFFLVYRPLSGGGELRAWPLKKIAFLKL